MPSPSDDHREAYLLLQHLAGMQIRELAAVLKPFEITPEQYHILRVLGSTPEDGLTCSALAERSPSGDPDVTRLLDRLEKRGWVTRNREAADRRVVVARITATGSQLLDRLAAAVATLHQQQFKDLGPDEQEALRLLTRRLARRQ